MSSAQNNEEQKNIKCMFDSVFKEGEDYTSEMKILIFTIIEEIISEYVSKIIKGVPTENIIKYVPEYYKDATIFKRDINNLHLQIQKTIGEIFIQIDQSTPDNIKNREDFKFFKKVWSNYAYWGVSEIKFAPDCFVTFPQTNLRFFPEFNDILDKIDKSDLKNKNDNNEIIFCIYSALTKVVI